MALTSKRHTQRRQNEKSEAAEEKKTTHDTKLHYKYKNQWLNAVNALCSVFMRVTESMICIHKNSQSTQTFIQSFDFEGTKNHSHTHKDSEWNLFGKLGCCFN